MCHNIDGAGTGNISPWPDSKKVFGVCIHPHYGGWFAIRSVIVFKNHIDLTLKQPHPVDCVHSVEDRVKLLNQFNLYLML